MSEYGPNHVVARPEMCPFCNGKKFDTLAKVITDRSFWRCRICESTWTISQKAAGR
jgi:hypothetical protein